MLKWLQRLMLGPPADPIAWDNGPQSTTVDKEILCDPDEPEVAFVFIHDVAEDCRDTWRVPGSDKFWPVEILAELFPKAYMIAYGYDASVFKTIASMFDEDILTQKANDLLTMFPLVIDPRGAASPPVADPGRNTKTPIVFFAHGYGGLIYEKAIEILIGDLFEISSSEEEQTLVLKVLRRHRAVFFGTPHFPAGLAEWAIISATRLGIVSGVSAQTYDWTGCEHNIDHFKKMQNTFRNFCDGLSVKQLGLESEYAADFVLTQGREIEVIGCVATLPLPNDNLFLSPEWSFLPKFIPLAINDNHFGMTRFASATKVLEYISQFVKKLDKIAPVTVDIGPPGVPTRLRDTGDHDWQLGYFSVLPEERVLGAQKVADMVSHIVSGSSRWDAELGSIVRFRAGPRGPRLHRHFQTIVPTSEIIGSNGKKPGRGLTKIQWYDQIADSGIPNSLFGTNEYVRITTKEWLPGEDYFFATLRECLNVGSEWAANQIRVNTGSGAIVRAGSAFPDKVYMVVGLKTINISNHWGLGQNESGESRKNENEEGDVDMVFSCMVLPLDYKILRFSKFHGVSIDETRMWDD
ncbi:hypothetical protein TWF730_007154 [Orbilia blumenaviensis]|uniref:Uncharacterized protein n=1 Tax=Orbilia blumenaviensis TaxID=1796055 RepID=A0AAV9VIN9_9PEZI